MPWRMLEDARSWRFIMACRRRALDDADTDNDNDEEEEEEEEEREEVEV